MPVSASALPLGHGSAEAAHELLERSAATRKRVLITSHPNRSAQRRAFSRPNTSSKPPPFALETETLIIRQPDGDETGAPVGDIEVDLFERIDTQHQDPLGEAGTNPVAERRHSVNLLWMGSKT